MVNGKVVEEGYSYADLTILRLSRAVRDKKLNMRSVCIALKHLIERLGYPSTGWADANVYIVNNHVYANMPSDTWDVTVADQGGQQVATMLFDDVFDILQGMEVGGDILLPRGVSKCVSINPRVMGGEPVIKDTRVPTAAIAKQRWNGTSIEDLVGLYYPITRECIECAIDYETFLNSPIQAARAVPA